MYKNKMQKTKTTAFRRVLEGMSNKTAWMIASWSHWY